MKALGLAAPGLELAAIVSGRNLGRRLGDLREEELKALVDTLDRYCPGNS